MKAFILFSVLAFVTYQTLACTTFCINHNGQIVFGRNYDWVTGAGILNSNQRGMFKTSMKTGNGSAISWVSKHGSLTFNQYGKEFPTGGMNERGLVVELMWLDGTQYPKPDQRPAIGVLQWIQYQLDNAATINDVITSDSQLRITEKGTPLHYLVADANGDVATIEFLDGKMVVHRDKELPLAVLTNDTYSNSINAVVKHEDLANASFQNNSLDRFAKACDMVNKAKDLKSDISLTDYAFSILDKVSQNNFTQWSIVYDITAKKINYKTAQNKQPKVVNLSAFDFSCLKPSKMFVINQEAKGDISNKFRLQDKGIKQAELHHAVIESSSRVFISKQEEEALLGFEDGVKCTH
jgi:penicillin V acylase-like amidase (Ntn superfamily)